MATVVMLQPLATDDQFRIELNQLVMRAEEGLGLPIRSPTKIAQSISRFLRVYTEVNGIPTGAVR